MSGIIDCLQSAVHQRKMSINIGTIDVDSIGTISSIGIGGIGISSIALGIDTTAICTIIAIGIDTVAIGSMYWYQYY
eukprot:scaffold31122_cov68-Cyclotella_meneghiniana.AAC.7